MAWRTAVRPRCDLCPWR
ncbi:MULTISPECIES: hypothetical protein [Citrobacter freundii complex]